MVQGHSKERKKVAPERVPSIWFTLRLAQHLFVTFNLNFKKWRERQTTGEQKSTIIGITTSTW